jgi:superfamily I DNA/RNA helicase
MRALRSVTPTAEQLGILSRTRPGVELIRGAAGSGKTTTALLRLKSLIGFFSNRRRREGDQTPLNILVLTYNRTLRGYIEALTNEQTASLQGLKLRVETFGRWSKTSLNNLRLVDAELAENQILGLGSKLGLSPKFLLGEVEYLLGRFLPSGLDQYLSVRRDGRGASPRMEKQLRSDLLETVVKPYQEWKRKNGRHDWNDLAVHLATNKLSEVFDIIVTDEAQDFSANQVRAVLNQLAKVHSLTFVLDSAQRIYPRGFTWQEAGITIRPENVSRLGRNYRNTIEIAKLAASLIKGVPIDDDGTLPDFATCTRHGPKPVLIRGRFGAQMEYVIDYIKRQVDLTDESVAFLHPQGGGWFSEVRRRLVGAGLGFVEITRQSDWPTGSQNIALSTLHSAKGLEFDHVIVVGLNAEVTIHGQEEDDDTLLTLRRLLAMGIGRARKSVILGCKPSEASRLIDYFDPTTYQAVDL